MSHALVAMCHTKNTRLPGAALMNLFQTDSQTPALWVCLNVIKAAACASSEARQQTVGRRPITGFPLCMQHATCHKTEG